MNSTWRLKRPEGMKLQNINKGIDGTGFKCDCKNKNKTKIKRQKSVIVATLTVTDIWNIQWESLECPNKTHTSFAQHLADYIETWDCLHESSNSLYVRHFIQFKQDHSLLYYLHVDQTMAGSLRRKKIERPHTQKKIGPLFRPSAQRSCRLDMLTGPLSNQRDG